MDMRLTQKQSESEAKRLTLGLQQTQSIVQPYNKNTYTTHKQLKWFVIPILVM